jgi:signal transduction histidine kinase
VLTIGRATIKDGKIVRVSGGIMDIDGLKRSQLETARLTAELEERVRERTAKLETINRDLESFTHAISHELKAPLRAIAGFSRMVAEDYAGALDDEGRRMLAVVHDNAVLLDGLLTEILRLARIGTYRLDRARIDMKSMAVAMFHEMASEADIAAVRFEVGDLPDCQGDSTLMRQVWGALLANALKFTAEQATRTITVGAEPGEGGTKYQIKDDGIGFDPAHADRLFLPFERLHPRAAYGGLGTGLAIAKRIVELHGGRIGADGKVGKGAVFWFTMPATTGEGVGGHDDTR